LDDEGNPLIDSSPEPKASKLRENLEKRRASLTFTAVPPFLQNKQESKDEFRPEAKHLK